MSLKFAHTLYYALLQMACFYGSAAHVPKRTFRCGSQNTPFSLRPSELNYAVAIHYLHITLLNFGLKVLMY